MAAPERDSISFSQVTTTDDDDEVFDLDTLVPQESVGHAIVAVDETEGALYQDLAIKTELQDCKSNFKSKEYLDKVYKIVVFAWKDLVLKLKPRTIEIYRMRYRSKWVGSDSVYDAWLMCNNMKRPTFPYARFTHIYPKWKKARDVLNKESPEETSDSDVCESDSNVEANHVMTQSVSIKAERFVCIHFENVIVISDNHD